MTVKICVLGAGVIGLTTAVNVQQTLPDAQVTIIADKFTVDTLSDGAAGVFRPSNSINGPQPDSVKKWAKDSYSFYKSVIDLSIELAGIKYISGYLLSKKFKDITESPILEELLPDWKSLTEQELQGFPGTWKFGVNFTTVLVECRLFLPWLTNKFLANGGIILKKHITKFEDLVGQYHVVVNCTGFSAKYLCKDNKLIPIRGQVYKVKAPWINQFYYGDYDTYIIPGFNTVTLGGTRQFDSFNEEVDIFDSKSIWQRCCALLPSVKDAVVEREFVGLRPHRDPVRLESEIMVFGNKKLMVVHNYGHGGYGVTLSWGCAKNAAELVKEAVKKPQFFSHKL